MAKEIKASDCKCIRCGKQAVAFWPCIDIDIPSYPYCANHLEEAMLDKACKYIETILFLHTAIKVEDIEDYVEKFRKLCRE